VVKGSKTSPKARSLVSTYVGLVIQPRPVCCLCFSSLLVQLPWRSLTVSGCFNNTAEAMVRGDCEICSFRGMIPRYSLASFNNLSLDNDPHAAIISSLTIFYALLADIYYLPSQCNRLPHMYQLTSTPPLRPRQVSQTSKRLSFSLVYHISSVRRHLSAHS